MGPNNKNSFLSSSPLGNKKSLFENSPFGTDWNNLEKPPTDFTFVINGSASIYQGKSCFYSIEFKTQTNETIVLLKNSIKWSYKINDGAVIKTTALGLSLTIKVPPQAKGKLTVSASIINTDFFAQFESEIIAQRGFNKDVFFEEIKKTIFNGKDLTKKQKQGIKDIINKSIDDYANFDDRWLAYILGTVYWETAHTMQPVDEISEGKGKWYGEKNKSSKLDKYTEYDFIYYGRGLVQTTGYYNYIDAAKKLGFADTYFLEQPDRVKEHDNALDILFGFMVDWRYGEKFNNLPYFFNGEKAEWKYARQIVNGKDHDEEIGNISKKYHEAILKAREDIIVPNQTDPAQKNIIIPKS